MLETIPGITGVPLSYIIRDNNDPIPDRHDNFVQKCIACLPLKGPKYEADTRQVH